MADVQEGTLLVTRWLKPRGNGRLSIGSMLADLINPRYYPPAVAVVAGEMVTPSRHEIVYAIRGKAIERITIEDHGRPVRVTGRLQRNPSTSKLGSFTRATIEFLDSPATLRSDSRPPETPQLARTDG
jgi:hypothetical protein